MGPPSRESEEKLPACGWPIGSYYTLHRLSEGMLGYSPMELHQFKPDLDDRDLNGYVKVFWDTMDSLKSFSLKLNEAPKEVLNAIIRLETHGLSVESEVKTRLADIFDGLTPQEQNL